MGPEQDRGLRVFIDLLLATVGKRLVCSEAPTAQGDAEPVLYAAPLRGTSAPCEGDSTRCRATDWELHLLTYQLLTSIDWLSAAYPELGTLVPETIREGRHVRPFSERVAQAAAARIAGRRDRPAEEVVLLGQGLPAAMTEALRAEAGRGE
ncbi:hypothetical protein GTY54_37310 [Streptomyces sp. SID625]|nr:hypothetical protein [Streptomyces sp. SID625]